MLTYRRMSAQPAPMEPQSIRSAFGRDNFLRVKIIISPNASFRCYQFLMLRQSSIRASCPSCPLLTATAALLLVLSFAVGAQAQTENSLDESSSDPMKLFERGQNAHARGDLERALAFYEEAIKVRPEFPEAEFQRGTVLASLKRFEDAETAFRKAAELKKSWALPHSSLGVLLVRLNRDREAETALRAALKLDQENEVALRVLADVRLRAGDAAEALTLARKATGLGEGSLSAWIVKAMAERSLGLKAEAMASLDHVIQAESQNVSALVERGQLHIDNNNYQAAIKDLREADRLQPGDKGIVSRLALALERDNQTDEAQQVAERGGLITKEASVDGLKVVGTPDEIAAANSDDPAVSREALKTLIKKNPSSAMLMARLGGLYRTENPAQSLEYYRRAAELQPTNPDYAVGYASALVQTRRFNDAVIILRRVLSVTPNHYAAHANLATALYGQKNFAEAISEYDWILKQKPDLAIAYYFIATAHDNLGEYPEALAAYEAFMARAVAQTNQLEIDKVKLRLPTLRRQIQLGEGAKRKRARN